MQLSPTLAFKISADLDIAMPSIYIGVVCRLPVNITTLLTDVVNTYFPPRVSFHSGAAAGCSEPFLHRVGHCQQGLDRSVSGVKGTCAETFLKLKEPV